MDGEHAGLVGDVARDWEPPWLAVASTVGPRSVHSESVRGYERAILVESRGIAEKKAARVFRHESLGNVSPPSSYLSRPGHSEILPERNHGLDLVSSPVVDNWKGGGRVGTLESPSSISILLPLNGVSSFGMALKQPGGGGFPLLSMKIDEIVVPKRSRKDMGNLDQLAASIKEIGLLHPPVVDGDNVLVAGGRRLKAVKMLGWTDVPVRMVKTLGEAVMALKAERDENTCREGLRPTEAFELGTRILKLIKPEAEKRKAEGQKSGGRGKKKLGADSAPSLDKTRDQISEAVEMGRDRYQKIGVVMAAAKANPELLPVVERMDATGNVNRAVREIARARVIENVKLPSGKFRVIYADPPWKYSDGLTERYGATEYFYPTMSIAELCAMPIRELCDPNAVLFLWVTAPLLDECFPVIKAWSFTYKTNFVWNKLRPNFGHYHNAQHEHLLLCTRGSCVPDIKELLPSVVEIKRGKHSEKPEEFRQMIDKMYPHGRRLELFARKETENWSSYGNQKR